METAISPADVQIRLERLSTLLDGFDNYTLTNADARKVATARYDSKKNNLSRQGSKSFFFTEVKHPEAPKNTATPLKLPRVPSSRMKPVIGGQPISYETAKELRVMTCGTGVHKLTKAWLRTGFVFQSLDSNQPYGLIAERVGSRGIVMCVQAFVLRHLIFRRYPGRADIYRNNVLKPKATERISALISALSEMLWKAGAKTKCTVCLPQDKALFERTPQYSYDGITEKLHLFEFEQYEDLHNFVKKYISYFEYTSTSGCLLFLYSLLLSRTINRLREDQCTRDNVEMLDSREACTQALYNLLLTGQAVQHIHNGDIVYDSEGELLDEPLRGIEHRADVGLLYWDREERDENRTEVGSKLRTPRHPIWITRINGYNVGVLFGLNPDLVGDWRAENWFSLTYYTGLSGSNTARLNIDTRSGRRLKGRTSALRRKEMDKIPSLERCIMSKYPGAIVDWNGLLPFV